MIEDQITLRDATPEDMPFLGRLYCNSRQQEVESWGWPAQQQEAFLRMQFEAQHRSYRAAFPDATHNIICKENAPIGRILVNREPVALHLVDIALLAEHRNCGIGSELLRRMQQACEVQSLTLRLQVLQGNPAIRLYRRLGFVLSSADQIYVDMDWVPAQVQERF